jgi:hypothetical protein
MVEDTGKRRDRKRSVKRAPKPPTGLPDPRSVVASKTFQSPKGSQYRILKTTERDPYDPPVGSNKKPT